MDGEVEEGDEFRTSTVPNTRRRIVTKTPLEGDQGNERTVAVTTQGSLAGIREKAMRIASLDEMGASSSARRGPSPGRVEVDKTKKARDIVRAFVSSIMTGGDTVVACDSKSKLWKDADLKVAMQTWSLKFVDIARSPESALRVFTSSERLANQMQISDMGKLVMDAPKTVKYVKKSEMGKSWERGRSWKTGEEDQYGRQASWRAGEEDPDD